MGQSTREGRRPVSMLDSRLLRTARRSDAAIVILQTATAAVGTLVSATAMNSQAVRSRPPVVLIVGDDDDAPMYAIALHFMGVHPVVAATADEAFACACEHHPDVVVADLSLGTPSLDLLRRLHDDVRTRAATLMALTAETGTAVARQAHAIGCHRFVSKACPPDALVWEILDALAGGLPRATRPAWRPA